jgi:uncharacterized membrane protein YfbV (UPF0208 family)
LCPACGAPQIRVSTQEQLSQSLPDDQLVAMGTNQINWRQFFRRAWLPALVAAIVAAFLPVVGLFVFIPLAVVVAIRVYLKRHSGELRAGQGASLGAAVVLIVFAIMSLPELLGLAFAGDAFRRSLSQQVAHPQFQGVDPAMQERLQTLVSTTQGVLLLMAFSLVFLLMEGGIVGALTAAWSKTRKS